MGIDTNFIRIGPAHLVILILMLFINVNVIWW